MTSTARILMTKLLLVCTIGGVAAQSTGRRGCAPPIAEAALGLTTIECLQCTLHSSGTDRWTEYGAEPVVRSVSRPSGPILPGDVLVAIDGRLITTAAGGLRLAHVDLFRSTVLTVRRGGRRMDVTVTPVTGCAFSLALDSVVRGVASMMSFRPDSSAPKPSYTVRLESPGRFRFVPIGNAISDTLQFHFERDTLTWKETRPFTRNGDTLRWALHGAMLFGPEGQGVIVTDSAGANVTRSTGDEPPTRGWAGFTIFCNGCTADSSVKDHMLLRFIHSPQVAGVDRGSAAEAAGLKYGMAIKEIDGLDPATPAGARRLSTLKPGDRVRFTLEAGYPVRRSEVVFTMPAMH